ncbi:MAG TPA: helix-turn-helix domain-containing protein [Chryseolinea sp.]|nr:helix-turn-helix domain-containing protein [Chryseolinea sp.]HPM31650.1 helix-turn-helix domain-containing protein [Chryseolinea sp.]
MSEFFKQLFLVFTYAGIGLGLFVVLILNNKSARRSRANLFLSILLISLSFSVAHILFAGAVIDHLSAQVYSIGDPTFYLIAPLLWFYTNELTGHRIRMQGSLLLHFIPFFLIVIFSLSFRSINSESFLKFLDYNHKLFTILFWVSVVVQFSVYLIFVRKIWIHYQKFVHDEVSNKEGIDIEWVRFFMIVFLLINLFFMFSLFAAIHLHNGAWLPKATALIFSVSIFALGYKGILQKELFQRDEAIPLDVPGESIPDSFSKPDQELLNKLLAYMTEKEPFLDAELTLSQLAKDINMSRSQLSVVINEGTGDNFYDFVNKYRVEEVKRLMMDPKASKYNLLGIAIEAGFKSKSTFNLIFKRFTGLTPSEYKRNLIP